MIFRFPLKDVTIKVTKQKKSVDFPQYSDNWNQITQNEFALDVEGVARYYACNGNYIEVYPYEGFNQQALELYMNGSVYGAILHQRKIIPLHGSCFIYGGKGIMVCGESGVGKSSLTAAFCLEGSEFLTDDVTPIVINNSKPYILTLSDRIKLWDDSIEQLNLSTDGLLKIDLENEKFYFPVESEKPDFFLLNQIFVLEIHDKTAVEFQQIKGAEKVTIIRNQIYRMEYLQGMPENESVFFEYLVNISNHVTITLVKRPAKIPIQQLMLLLKKYIA